MLNDGKVLLVGGKVANSPDCCCDQCDNCECCSGGDMCFSKDYTPGDGVGSWESSGTTGIYTTIYWAGEITDLATYANNYLGGDSFEGPPICGDDGSGGGSVTWEQVVYAAVGTDTGVDRLVKRFTYASGASYKLVVQHTSDGGATWDDSITLVESGTPYVGPDDETNQDKCYFRWTTYTNLTGTHTSPLIPFTTVPSASIGGLGNKCCKDPDSGACRCLPLDCKTGECLTCSGGGDACCLDYRSELDITISGISFDISSISDPDTKARAEADLAAIGLSNGGSDDVWDGTISRHGVYGVDGGFWVSCGDSAGNWRFTFQGYSRLVFGYLQGGIDTSFISNTIGGIQLSCNLFHDVGDHAEPYPNDFTCCGGTGEMILHLVVGGIEIDSVVVNYSATVSKNKCCNCRGTSRDVDGGHVCGPTADGSNATCDSDSDGDSNTCPDPDGVTARNNICSSSQDSDCLRVCELPDSIPDMLTVSIGGIDIPLTRVGNQWTYHCCDGEISTCDLDMVIEWDEIVHHDAEDYDYVCDYEYDPETDEYTPVYCHYHADAYDETVHHSNTGRVMAAAITFGGCGGPCVSGSVCYSLEVGIVYGGCGQTNPGACFAYGYLLDSCDDPRGNYCLFSGACGSSDIPDDCTITATVS